MSPCCLVVDLGEGSPVASSLGTIIGWIDDFSWEGGNNNPGGTIDGVTWEEWGEGSSGGSIDDVGWENW